MELAKMFDELQGSLEYQESKLKLIEHLNNRYTHDISNALKRIYEFINKEAKLKEHKKMNLLDLVDIERSKKNKLYPADSILIQLSATRGQMQYMNKSGPADAKYGVMMLKDKNINPRYLYFILNMNMGPFLNVYQTELNIVPEVFKFMDLEIHTDRQIQDKIAAMFDDLENIEISYQKEIAKWKDIKQFHLDNMFI
ncbi:restriction endonuclease subunit S [Faecalibacillus intestinalis]|uniref:restriction endonuclease subunit S n=1 Tax=Faecalibacillus intestinalis TaxID=1982626 RepID=UPI003993F399